MMFRTTSHRARSGVDRVLGRHPAYYFTWKVGGCFVKVDDPEEIEKVLALKGVSKCQCQDETKYKKCWQTGATRE